jgi:hypothetical protein
VPPEAPLGVANLPEFELSGTPAEISKSLADGDGGIKPEPLPDSPPSGGGVQRVGPGPTSRFGQTARGRRRKGAP